MKFYSQDLKKILPTILQAVPQKSTLPILECLYLKLVNSELTIIGSNQVVTIRMIHQVDGSEDGEVLIPAKMFNEVIKTLDGFELITDGTDITIQTPNGKYEMKGLDPDDYLDITFDEFEHHIELDGTNLSKVMLAVSLDEYRPTMTGVFMEIVGGELNLVATDSFKLLRYKTPTSSEETSMILNKEFCNIIKKYPTINLSFNDKQVRADIENLSIISLLIDEKFPPYQSVVPTDLPIKIYLNRTELLKAVRRSSIFSDDTSKNIKLEFEEGCKITASDGDSQRSASETIECNYRGEKLIIGMNYNNLIEVLNNIETGIIELECTNNQKPILLSNNELLTLIMPVRV